MLLLAVVLGVVISDSIFAVILGISFTSTIALMAWIVKTLAGIAVTVEDHDDRLGRLEEPYWRRRATPAAD